LEEQIVGNIAKGDGEPLKTLSNGHAISSTRKARLMFAERSFSPPIIEINLKKTSVKAVYELPFKVTVENKLRSYQFKLIHNIIPTNLSLYKMSMKILQDAIALFSKTKHLSTCFVSALMLKSSGKTL